MKKLWLSVLVLLATLVLAGTSVYAFWDIITVSDSTYNVSVGSGDTKTITADLSAVSDKKLVPVGYVDSTDKTDSITFTATVKLPSDKYTLDVSYITSSTLLKVTHDTYTVGSDGTTIITFTVTLDEPSTKADYDSVANKTLIVTVSFTTSALL